MKVFIILVDWKGWRHTLRCLESLRQLDYPIFRTVVVNNNPNEEDWRPIADWARDSVGLVEYPAHVALQGGDSQPEADAAQPSAESAVVLIHAVGNLGFTGGCNLGMRYALAAGADAVWLLNNDTVADPQALRWLVEAATADVTVGPVGSTIRDMEPPHHMQAAGGGRLQYWLGRAQEVRDPGQPVDYICGASLLVTRAVIECIGLLNDSYFLYWEDVEYSRRAVAAGYKLAVATDSVIYHRLHGSSPGEGPDAGHPIWIDACQFRNRVDFILRFGGSRRFAAVLLGPGATLLKRVAQGKWPHAAALAGAWVQGWRTASRNRRQECRSLPQTALPCRK